jgi:hypothetical protein
MLFVTNPFPRAKAESWPEALLSNPPDPSKDSFCKPLRPKSSKIPVARRIRWRQPQPNELARTAVRCFRKRLNIAPCARCREPSRPKQTPPPSLLPASCDSQHYTVLKSSEGKAFELGRGGMGITYKAIDTLTPIRTENSNSANGSAPAPLMLSSLRDDAKIAPGASNVLTRNGDPSGFTGSPFAVANAPQSVAVDPKRKLASVANANAS